MKIQTAITENNIKINLIDTDKFKTGYFSINFISPLDPDEVALNTLLPSVLMRGTVNYPKMIDINRQLDKLYQTRIFSKNQRCGDIRIFGFGCEFLDNSYALDNTDIFMNSLELLSEIINSPYTENGVFAQSYVESEKKNLIDEIRAKINNKTSYAVDRCREEMCKNEKYGAPTLGKIEDAEAVTAESLYNYYKKVISTSKIEIYFVGSAKMSEIYPKINKLFGSLISRTDVKLTTEVIKSIDKVKEIEECQPVKQGKLSMGFRTASVLSDDDYINFSVFNELFGVSATGKLFTNVREKLSLCYYCHSIPEAHKGIMIVSCGIENKNKQRAQDEILHQLEDVKNGVITDSEFNSAIKALKNGYAELYDSPTALERWYLRRMLAGRYENPCEVADSLDTVTKESVADAARKIVLDTVYFMKGTDCED